MTMRVGLARCFGLGLVAILTNAGGVAGIATTPHVLQILVTDLHSHRIARINGMAGTGWTTFGSHRPGGNQFDAPEGIPVTAAGQSFVRDPGDARLGRINRLTGRGRATLGPMRR